jgi:aconitate hydratase
MPVAFNLAEKLIHSHLVTGSLMPGQAIAVSNGQTLLRDAPGTLVMLELEAMGIDRVKVGLTTQYIDWNLDELKPRYQIPRRQESLDLL